MEFTIHLKILTLVFVTTFVMGAVSAKTNFCTMGAVSDWVNMGDKGRLRAWFLAIAVALGGVLFLGNIGAMTLGSDTFPPYRMAQFAWPRYLIGGLLFGIGMTLGSGCGNKTLLRLGGGNLKSVVVAVMIAASAYLMVWTEFFNNYMMPWLRPMTIDLTTHGATSQELGTILAALTGMTDANTMNAVVGWGIVAIILVWVFSSREFVTQCDNVCGGLVVGLTVLSAWYITSGSMGDEWKDWAAFSEEPPSRVTTQSHTFIAPMADAMKYLMNPKDLTQINFGIVGVLGVFLGSFFYTVTTRKFHFEWFASGPDFIKHVVGGSLMGIGGVLGLGCTIGQGVSGVSTLALGSMMTLGGILFGGALTMKVEYYLMDEKGFFYALRAALADLRLAPRPRV